MVGQTVLAESLARYVAQLFTPASASVCRRGAVSGFAEVEELEWGKEGCEGIVSSLASTPVDWVLAADCCYIDNVRGHVGDGASAPWLNCTPACACRKDRAPAPHTSSAHATDSAVGARAASSPLSCAPHRHAVQQGQLACPCIMCACSGFRIQAGPHTHTQGVAHRSSPCS